MNQGRRQSHEKKMTSIHTHSAHVKVAFNNFQPPLPRTVAKPQQRQQSRWMWCDYQTDCASAKTHCCAQRSSYSWWFVENPTVPLESYSTHTSAYRYSYAKDFFFFFVLHNYFFVFSFLLFSFPFGTFWCTCQQLVYQIHHILTHTQHYRKSISFSSGWCSSSSSSGHRGHKPQSCWMNFLIFFFSRV